MRADLYEYSAGKVPVFCTVLIDIRLWDEHADHWNCSHSTWRYSERLNMHRGGSEERPVLQSLTSRNTSSGERKSSIMKYVQRESAQSKTHPGKQQQIQPINLSVSSCSIKLLSLTLDIYLGGDVDSRPCKNLKKKSSFSGLF